MVALLNSLAANDDCCVEVLYLGKSAPERQWGSPAGQLPHRFLKGITLMKGGLRINGGLIQALRQKAVETLVAPIKETLTRYEDQIKALEKMRGEHFGSLSEQVRQLLDSEQRLQRETANLVNALRTPSVRGRWGRHTAFDSLLGHPAGDAVAVAEGEPFVIIHTAAIQGKPRGAI
jgi:hypothetical protein